MGISSQSEPARTLGKYTLLEKLGEGSLGPVYRGFDPELDRAVVVRILWDGIKWDAQIEELFFRECRSVAGLQHPSIAAIYETGMEGQSPYIVMESLGSNSLENLIARKPAMLVKAKLSIMIRVTDALSHAHKNGILHSDLGPAKVHLTADGSVKIRDFAIAHALMKYLPHPGVRWGVPIYLSPEQVQNKNCDERSDIFSLGTIFYELLTYAHPFHDQNGNKALDNILLDTEIPTFDQFPNEPPGIWPILKTCLARNSKDRYQSMDEVSSACRELLKDVADDTRFMLAELHASLAPLKRAAAQPNASKSTVRLLQDVQRILCSDEQADYASLDRLMTDLIEQQPAIQEAAGALQALETERLWFPPQDTEIAVSAEAAALPSEPEIDESDMTPQTQDAATFLAPSIAEQPVEQPAATLLASDIPEQAVEPAETQQIPPAESVAPEETMAPPESHFAATSEPQPSPVTAPIEREAETPAAGLNEDAVPPAEEAPQNPISGIEPDSVGTSPFARRFFRIPRPTYRSAAVLLSALLIAAAIYIALEKGAAASLSKAWAIHMPDSQQSADPVIPQSGSRNAKNRLTAREGMARTADPNTSSILLKEALALAAMNRFEESKVLIHRILEIDPACEAAGTALKEVEELSGRERVKATDPTLQKRLVRVSQLMNSGKLPPAKAELDKLQQIYPDSLEANELRKLWQSRNAKETQERMRQEEENQKAARKHKDDEWNRKLTELFALGKYSEAGGALNLWLTEDPGNSRAREFSAKIQEIQRDLKAYSQAISENRYQDALGALGSAERLNPADPIFADLRRQFEAKKAAAKATLTIHRLGAKGILLLDGRPIGNDGEATNESVAIGSHTLAIEYDGSPVVLKNQEFLEGQSVVLAYDMANQHLRPMTEADRELLAQRRVMEAVHRFTLEHSHGIFRGNCGGVLSISYSEVAYKPATGLHGFHVPFKLLKIRIDSKTLDLLFASDNAQFQSFKFSDAQTAEKFKQIWNELKALPRQQ